MTKIFKVIEEVRFEIIASRREQQEIIRKLDTLFMQNNNTNVNKFSRLLPISSMECFDEIDQGLINSEEDFISLVRKQKNKNNIYIYIPTKLDYIHNSNIIQEHILY